MHLHNMIKSSLCSLWIADKDQTARMRMFISKSSLGKHVNCRNCCAATQYYYYKNNNA